MQKKPTNIALFLTLFLSNFCLVAQHAITISAFSYHPARKTTDGKTFNEFNPGASYRYFFNTKNQSALRFAEAGYYYDSGFHHAFYASAGYQWKLAEKFFFGAAALVIKTKNLNSGKATFGAVPIVSYKVTRSVLLNLIIIPNIPPNEYLTFGFTATYAFPRKRQN